jgi:hypothetical protein
MVAEEKNDLTAKAALGVGKGKIWICLTYQTKSRKKNAGYTERNDPGLRRQTTRRKVSSKDQWEEDMR